MAAHFFCFFGGSFFQEAAESKVHLKKSSYMNFPFLFMKGIHLKFIFQKFI